MSQPEVKSATPASRFRAIIFDLDGTLLDTLDDIAAAMNDALRSLAFPMHPPSSYRQFVGDGAQMLAARALPGGHRDPVTIQSAYELYLRCYGRRWNFQSHPYDGIPQLLDACVARGLQLAVFSNKADAFTGPIIRALLPHWTWAVIQGQRPGVPKKPAPDGAHAIVQRLGLTPPEVIFLGDSGVNMECANAAGLCSVGALWGFRPESELTAARAAHLIATPADLLALL